MFLTCLYYFPDQPELLYPASILIAYGGYAVLLTNMQLGNLLPRFRSTIISLYCGAYDSSAFVLVFVKVRQVALFSLFGGDKISWNMFMLRFSCATTQVWRCATSSSPSLPSSRSSFSALSGSFPSTASRFRCPRATTSTSAAGFLCRSKALCD